MTKDEQNYIQHCILHAKESYKEAQVLAKNELWNGCANRLYYACFHSVSGLLYKHKTIVKTHKGMDIQFKLHFVKTGIISKEQGDLFTDLNRMRNESDYGKWKDLNRNIVKPFIAPVKKFLHDIEKLIKETN